MPGLVLTFALGLLFLGHCPSQTLANTQIINFPAGRPVPVAPLPQNWTTVLHAAKDEILVWDMTPAPRHTPCKDDDGPGECPHDLWLALDLDGPWTHYDRFTLRVSWPASHSTAVALSLHPAPLPSHAPAPAPVRTARHHFARVRLTEEGVRVPYLHATHMRVPLVVRLEPLVLGVLPASMLPVAATLLVVLAVAARGVLPLVLRIVEKAVGATRREIEFLEKRRAR